MCKDLDIALLLAIESDEPGHSEIAALLLAHGANANQRYGKEVLTPVLVAAREDWPKLVDSLMEAGADFTAADYDGWTTLHHAAVTSSPAIFAKVCGMGADLHSEDNCGILPLHLAMELDNFTSLLVNIDCRMELSPPFPWRVLAGHDQIAWICKGFKLYKKRFGETLLRHITNMQPKGHLVWSPLCRMSVEGNTTVMANLLELGACVDYEGSPDGSALMAACANGQLESVKLLVRRGASLSYVRGTQGQHVSCLRCARGSSEITHWLLVGRFTDQPKLTASQASPDPESSTAVVKAWSGPAKAELIITGLHEREPTESSREYFVRLQRLRRDMRGTQVPSAVPGRKTCRPSRLVPWETVRVHPDDKRLPR